MNKIIKLSLVVLSTASVNVKAQTITVSSNIAAKATEIQLVNGASISPIAIEDTDDPLVKRVATFFAEDVKRVTGREPKITNVNTPSAQMIIAGTIGKNAIIDRLIATGKLPDAAKIKGQWEASLWQIVNNPAPGIKKALVIVGSDRRGTAYGLIGLSQKIGVSPWYWWADVPSKQKKTLTLSVPKPTWDKPAVKYRGIFINDEDWGINEWARKTFEKEFANGVGPKTYEKVFELMLRLRLNYIWPAMHEVSKEFGDTPENIEMADRYGIVAGSSHCEPMLYNNIHWNATEKGRWNYSTNRDVIFNTWKKTTMDRRNEEAVWTLGIRGVHDLGMEAPPTGIPERITLLEQVFKDQRGLIGQYVTPKYGSVAQTFVPYKEVLTLYDAGLKVPEDVTLMWVDDNFGYVRRLSNPDERKRPGGSGLYWHLSYYGGPHSYTWINTMSPALMWEEFNKAWQNDARTMWVLNVGDIKPMELGTDYFARLAWNPESGNVNAQPEFLKAFITENFGATLSAPVSDVLNRFYKLGTIRKPELMNRAWALSLSDQRAAELKAEYEALMKADGLTENKIPVAARDAYYEMIGFPAKVVAASGLIFMHDRDIVFGAEKDKHQAEIDRLRALLEKEVSKFNNDIAGGKWQHMMPGTVTAKNLLAWNSQVAWPWGETRKPDTTRRAKHPDVVRLASSAERKTTAGVANWTAVPGLGTSGMAMSLQPATLESSWAVDDAKAPTMEYSFKGDGKSIDVMIDFLPTFRVYPGMQLRVAVGVDGNFISTVEVPGSNGKEDENGPNRNQGIRNNYVRATVSLPALSAGTHKLFIRAVDPGVVIDKISFMTTGK